MSASHLPFASDRIFFKDTQFRRMLTGSWMVFLTLSVGYCYAYAWAVDGPYAATLLEALRCVSYDWLIWAFVSPALISRSYRHSLDDASPWGSLMRLLLMTTLLVGAFRISLESFAGELTVLEVALIYLPRYFFIGAFIVVGALLYRRLEVQTHAAAALKSMDRTRWTAQDTQPDHLIVTKGAAKVVLPIAEIICVSASGSNYLDVCSKTQCYLMRGTIKAMEQRLAAAGFVRIHRSHMVQLDAIESASRANMEVRLINGKKVRLGLSYLHHLPHFSRAQNGNELT